MLTIPLPPGRPRAPLPTALTGRRFAPVPYRPVPPRAPAPTTTGPSVAVPPGFLDAAQLAARWGVPERVVLVRAARRPHAMPAHVVVDGRPYFDPAAVTASAAAPDHAPREA